MLFEKVIKQHVLDAIEDFNVKSISPGYKLYTIYDLLHNKKTYPPKAILTYTNYHHIRREIKPYFSVGIGTDCLKFHETLGF